MMDPFYFFFGGGVGGWGGGVEKGLVTSCSGNQKYTIKA